MTPSARPVCSASLLMPTWQGMEFLERVFDALAAQRWDRPFDVHVVDSSSTDGTFEFLSERARGFPVPMHVRRIHPVEFDHGDTRNSLAARSEGDLLVFLTQDAIPVGPDWLARLAANFDAADVGAAYCRNVPRADARALTKLHSSADPGYAEARREVRLPDGYAALNAHERRLLYNFNDVASAVRRELWELHPFPRTWFGEDVLMARALLEAGWAIVYEADAVVEHSHDYDAPETQKRAEIDGRFNAEWLDRVCVGSAKDAATLTERVVAQDAAQLAALGLPRLEQDALLRESRALRTATFRGLYEGGRTARRRPASRALSHARLRLLYVVHGFPPETWAGTEVYTLNLAREMQARGHDVTVLTRSPAAGDEPDFSVRQDEFEGLRVLRMTQRLAHTRIRDSYLQPKAEATFRRVLEDARPDLVHFQHLIHTSVGLVEVARAAGLPTVVHCHDFWALCSRVQMIRPDGQNCATNMGSGCFLCVKEKGLQHVERAHRLDGALGATRLLSHLLGAAGFVSGKRGKGQRRATEYADVRAREEVVPAAFAAADLCVSPSRFLRERLLESGHFDAHRFLYSENGMRTDHVHALAKRPDPRRRVRFGFVGSLVWYKGGETLVRAMNRLAGRNAVLYVWGAFEPERDAHHRELASLAAAGNVEFKGRFDNARLAEVYADIDVLVVPSLWYENAPVTIREAFLTRTPVVTSGVGGMAESVRDGVDGLHFTVGDANDLAAKLERFLDEPDLIARLSSDFPDVKSIADDARDMEYRYRALCCLPRPAMPAAGVLLDVTGAQATAMRGAAERQGASELLLRPGASADYDLAGLAAGELELEIEQLALGAEPQLTLGGEARIDGVLCGALDVETSGGSDRTLVARMTLTLADRPRTLTLSATRAAGAPVHLRIVRVRLRRTAADAPRASQRSSMEDSGQPRDHGANPRPAQSSFRSGSAPEEART